MQSLMKECRVNTFKYLLDDTQSFHRVLDRTEQQDILSYYEKHVYIDSDFVPITHVKKIAQDLFLAKYRRDTCRTDKIFSILQKWGIIPIQNCNILDLGCGYGVFISQWKDKGYGYGCGIELSPLAKQISPIADSISIGDVNQIENLPIPEDISLVVAFDIIEHLFDVKHVLQTIFLKSGPNLKVLIEIPIVQAGTDDKLLANYKYLYPTRHLHLYTRYGIEQIIFECGFRIIESETLKNGNKYLILIEKDNKNSQTRE